MPIVIILGGRNLGGLSHEDEDLINKIIAHVREAPES